MVNSSQITSPRGHPVLTSPAVGAQFQDFPIYGPISKHSYVHTQTHTHTHTHTQKQVSSPNHSSTLQGHGCRHMGFTNLVFSFWNTPRLLTKQLALFSGDENNWAKQHVSCWVCPTSHGLGHAHLDHRNTQASTEGTREENISLLHRWAQWFEQGHAGSTWKTQGSKQSTNPAVLTRSLSFLCFLRHIFIFLHEMPGSKLHLYSFL